MKQTEKREFTKSKGVPIEDTFNKRRDGRVPVPGYRDIGTPANPVEKERRKRKK